MPKQLISIPRDPALKRPRRWASRVEAMTMIEVLMSMFILATALMGILAVSLQSRRATEYSIYQNTAQTVIQGYLEQMKNMDLNTLTNANAAGVPNLGVSYLLRTQYNDTTQDDLLTSTGTPMALSAITPGTTPTTGAVMDNLRTFDMMKDLSSTNFTSTDTSATSSALTWQNVWPGAYANNGGGTANPYPNNTSGTLQIPTVPGATDMHINLWVWVTDLSGATANAQKVYGITLIYTWQYVDGGRVRYATGSIRSIRSAVPSF